jgi:site-specific DNA-methyltransferase (adenine-specific)
MKNSTMVIQADCIDYMLGMEDGSVYLTLTDIPYSVVNRPSNGLRGLDKGVADPCGFSVRQFSEDVARVTAGSAYIFCGTEQVSAIRAALDHAGMTTRLCIWEKSNPSPMNGQHVWLSGVECCVFGKHKGAVFNEHCKNTVWRYPVPRKRDHPTPKPVDLLKYLIEVSSQPGDLVFDPCCGGGSTAVAAAMTGRRYLCLDSDPQCVEWSKKWVSEIGESVAA